MRMAQNHPAPLDWPVTPRAHPEVVLAAMMGSCCGVERGSRGRWRTPLRISVHGEGSEGTGLESRWGRSGVCGLAWLGTVLAALPRAMVPTMASWRQIGGSSHHSDDST